MKNETILVGHSSFPFLWTKSFVLVWTLYNFTTIKWKKLVSWKGMVDHGFQLETVTFSSVSKLFTVVTVWIWIVLSKSHLLGKWLDAGAVLSSGLFHHWVHSVSGGLAGAGVTKGVTWEGVFLSFISPSLYFLASLGWAVFLSQMLHQPWTGSSETCELIPLSSFKLCQVVCSSISFGRVSKATLFPLLLNNILNKYKGTCSCLV